MAEYENDNRGFVLANVVGGYRYQTDPSMAPYVERFVEGQTSRLSAAATRNTCDRGVQHQFRECKFQLYGVNVDAVIRTLAARI